MEDLTKLEMRLGDHICKLIKQIYYLNDTWQASYRNIGTKFSLFKRIMRTFYPDIVDITDILKKVQEVDTQYIDDVFGFEERVNQKSGDGTANPANPAKYGKKVTWVPISIERVELLEAVRQITVNDSVIDISKIA
jgi:hypothetical protein